MRVKRRDSEQWMHHRLLPQELRERVRRYDQYKWLATRGVDEENLVQSLPKDLQRDIKRHLCLALVRRVCFQTLENYPIFYVAKKWTKEVVHERINIVNYSSSVFGEECYMILF